MESNKKHVCSVCNQKFSRKSGLKRHMSVKHEYLSLNYSCYLCRKNFKTQHTYLKHIDSHKEGLNFVLFKQAFDDTVQIFRKYVKNYFSLNDIFNEIPSIQDFLQKHVLEYPKYKVNINVQVEYILKGTDNVISEKELFNLRSSNFIISRSHSHNSMKIILRKRIS